MSSVDLAKIKERIKFHANLLNVKKYIKVKCMNDANTIMIKFTLPKEGAYDDYAGKIHIVFDTPIDGVFSVVTHTQYDESDLITSDDFNNEKFMKKHKRFIDEVAIGRHILNNYFSQFNPNYAIINNNTDDTECNITDIETFIYELMLSYKTGYYGENSFHKMCSICHKYAPTYSYCNECIRVCTDVKCIIKSRSVASDNMVMNKYLYEVDCAKLLIKLATHAIFSKDRFTPYPLVIVDNEVVDHYASGVGVFSTLTKNNTQIKLEEKLLKLLDTCSKIKYYDDYALCKEHPKTYEFLKFVFMNNRMNIGYFDMTGNDEVLNIAGDVWKNNSIVFSVTHDSDTEKRFMNSDSTNDIFAFHGSPIHSWYSISEGGLKNYSGTAKMTTGKAYGSGIYLGKQEATSMSYSKKANGEGVLAIVQLKNSEKYDKGFCYVVPNEDDVLIRYLIYIRKDTNEKKEIVKYLINEMKYVKMQSLMDMARVTLKRINAENTNIKKFVKRYNKKNSADISISIDKETDSIDININDDIVNVLYDETFPMLPPKITITIDSSCEVINYIDPVMTQNIWNAKYEISEIAKYIVENFDKIVKCH
jgi:hypothetical protein